MTRRILLCVTGLSPQVVTETLYALAHRQWIPTEIHVITTAEGKRRAELALLSGDPGWFHRLRKDLDLPPIAFDARHIHCIEGADGRALDDIRTPDDNERAADVITEQVRRLTEDPETELHVSIAGGRKTMGFYLGYALSLFGRPQDRLSHVLVSEPFESSWEFFYPTPYSRVIGIRNQSLADTRDAEVTLAEIPFVRMRDGLDEGLLRNGARFSELVAAAQQAVLDPTLAIDLECQSIEAGAQRVRLPPRLLAFYSLFARRRLEEKQPLTAPDKNVPDPAWAERFLNEYRRIRGGELDDIERTERALANGMDGDYFSECKSKLHRILRQKLGGAAKRYLIDDGGERPRRYSLSLPRDAVCYRKLADRPGPADGGDNTDIEENGGDDEAPT